MDGSTNRDDEWGGKYGSDKGCSRDQSILDGTEDESEIAMCSTS